MKKRIVMLVFLGGLASILAAGTFWFFSEVRRKQDLTNTMHNLRLVYTRMEGYKEKHGRYPDQQNMKALLKTLCLTDHDFFQVKTIDIGSAVYHAPMQNSEEPILTIRIKPRIFRKKAQRIVMRKYEAYYETMKEDGR